MMKTVFKYIHSIENFRTSKYKTPKSAVGFIFILCLTCYLIVSVLGKIAIEIFENPDGKHDLATFSLTLGASIVVFAIIALIWRVLVGTAKQQFGIAETDTLRDAAPTDETP